MRSSSSRIRPRAPLLGLGVLVLTLWTAVGVAVGVQPSVPIALASWGGSSYAADASAFAPVSISLAEELTGARLLATPHERAGQPLNDSGSPVRDQGLDDVLPGPEDPQGRPILKVSMSASPSRVKVGEVIRFTITVVNVGSATARDVLLESEVPPHTTFGDEVECVAFLPPPTHQCISAFPYDPPLPISMLIKTLPPGTTKQRSFSVTVVSMPPDGRIRNSASASADNHPTVVNSNTVVVGVTPP